MRTLKFKIAQNGLGPVPDGLKVGETVVWDPNSLTYGVPVRDESGMVWYIPVGNLDVIKEVESLEPVLSETNNPFLERMVEKCLDRLLPGVDDVAS